MAERTTVRAVVESLNRGTVVFQEEDWSDLIKGTLVGMVANSEIVRCEHGEFVFYMAWQESPSDSESNVAHRMAKAIVNGKSR